MNENGFELTKKLALYLEQVPLSNEIGTELELEREIRKKVQEFIKQNLKLEGNLLDKIIYSHGDTPFDKTLWTSSKILQNVVVYGCSNTSDIFIAHPTIGSIYIELKLSKAKSRNSNSLPGDLQRSIGQSIIASLRHPHVICMVVCKGSRASKSNDMGNELKMMLLEKHGIFLIVRTIS